MRLTTLEGQYQCIVIDPPWFYRLRNQDKTHRNRINYKPMHIEEILSLPVPDFGFGTQIITWSKRLNACKHGDLNSRLF